MNTAVFAKIFIFQKDFLLSGLQLQWHTRGDATDVEEYWKSEECSGRFGKLVRCVTLKVYGNVHVPCERAQQKMMQSEIYFKIFIVNPSGISLPGTELLQSPFRTEFSMGSRSRQYWRSLRRHRRFLSSYCQFMRSYRRSLLRCRDP